MMLDQRKCPICFNLALWGKPELKEGEIPRALKIECPRCLCFFITMEAVEALNGCEFTSPRREWLSEKSRECYNEGRVFCINTEMVKSVSPAKRTD